MIRVEEAELIIASQQRDFGVETVAIAQASMRILAEEIRADRDLPPFNRSTMDGIAVSFAAYTAGIRRFRIAGTQAAGDQPLETDQPDQCIEIMTGAALPASADTVIPYEDVQIRDGLAGIMGNVEGGQNIHPQGQDRKEGETLVSAYQPVTPFVLAVAASVGKSRLLVRKLPRAVIISTGNELVEVAQTPTPYQIRRSNNYMIQAALQPYGMQPDMLHLPDDLQQVRERLAECLADYDVILLSGGVSMGKFDYLPKAFDQLGITQLIYKVQQRPGKPLWFGSHPSGPLVFAFPGNPVASFLCLLRYFVPWLQASLGAEASALLFATLTQDFLFPPALQYFLQVKLTIDPQGSLAAAPQAGNGSGDFSNLLSTNAFMELPLDRSRFKKGELYRVWPYQSLFL